MLDPNFILWDVGYPLYKYGSIFIIALIIWHVKRSYQGLRLGPDKSCYKCYRRIKHRPRDRTPKAKRTSKEEAEKLQKLLTILKSQGWLPQEGSVRRLLCSDPSCSICNAMALEIQQLLGYENKETCLTTLRPSQTFSSLEALASSKALFDKSSQDSRDPSLASSLTPPPSTDQKSSTQSAAPSTGDASFRYYRGDHQQKLEAQGAGSLSSSSVEEPGAPANQQKKKITKLVLKNEEPPEAEGENKMTFFSHWVNPEVNCEQLEEPIVLCNSETEAKPKNAEPPKNRVNPEVNCEQLEEPIVLCNSETEAKPKTAEPPKNPTPVRDHTGANMKSTTEDWKAKPLCAKN